MKKIINGKKYNTETAKFLVITRHGYYNDFNYYEETLYRKRTGEYFLHGEGGANSKYSRSVGLNSWSGGEDIIPMTEEEAKQWAEDNISVNTYENIFGEVEE